jgi:hypothetical protein
MRYLALAIVLMLPGAVAHGQQPDEPFTRL